MNDLIFQPWPKTPRLFREIVVTEKIDGTNAQVFIFPANEIGVEGIDPKSPEAIFQEEFALAYKDGYAIAAGSRNRFLTREKDNFGFAKFVQENADSLFDLGEGRHFGEWWGKGIQRGYDLDYKMFSLFNTARWNLENCPACCSVVPILWQGVFSDVEIDQCLQDLKDKGSVASPGFMDPEGVIVFHTAANQTFKYTMDDGHKEIG